MSHICCGQVYIYISWTNIYLFIINNVANWRPFCTLRTLSYQLLTTFMPNVLALLNINTCWHLLMPFILWIFPRCRTDWTVLSRKNPVTWPSIRSIFFLISITDQTVFTISQLRRLQTPPNEAAHAAHMGNDLL